MNVNDSEMMAGLLSEAGYVQADSPGSADVILINTCCVRQRAEDKAIGYALGLVAPKMRKPGRVIGIIGCIAEKDKNEIFKKLPFVDLVVGPGQEARVVQLIEEVKSGGEKAAVVGDNCGEYPSRSAKRKPSVQAYVTIMFGCDNFCSYCIVPYVRGRERSRPAKDIIGEIEELDKSIYKEIVLLGQNVNNYRDATIGTRRDELCSSNVESGVYLREQLPTASGTYGLAELLRDVHKIDGVERIRFLTSHPRDMSDDIIDAVSDLPKVCEYFHIPLQSGDDEILKRMNRGYTSGQFRELVRRIRLKIPEAAITSDAIAGFPGETDEQFKHTLDLISELELDLVNTFSYSTRPGTPAAKMDGQIDEKAKKERLQALMKVVEGTALRKNQGLMGTIQEVLIDSSSKDGLTGRTRGNKIVQVDGADGAVGKLLKVKITGASAWGLKASM